MGKGIPECTAKYYPAQGGVEGGSIESAGMPGEKEAMPSVYTGTQNGDYNTTEQSINASEHGRPAVSADPDNITGSLDDYSDNPTKAEGSTNTQA